MSVISKCHKSLRTIVSITTRQCEVKYSKKKRPQHYANKNCSSISSVRKLFMLYVRQKRVRDVRCYCNDDLCLPPQWSGCKFQFVLHFSGANVCVFVYAFDFPFRSSGSVQPAANRILNSPLVFARVLFYIVWFKR